MAEFQASRKGVGRFCLPLSLSEVSGDGATNQMEEDDEDTGIRDITYARFFGATGSSSASGAWAGTFIVALGLELLTGSFSKIKPRF